MRRMKLVRTIMPSILLTSPPTQLLQKVSFSAISEIPCCNQISSTMSNLRFHPFTLSRRTSMLVILSRGDDKWEALDKALLIKDREGGGSIT